MHTLGLKTVEYTTPDGVQQVIFLKSRLSLAAMGAFHTAYQAIANEHNGIVSALELRVLLLVHYLHSWRGGVFDRVPCDAAALNLLDADMPMLHLAMDAAYHLHFDDQPLPTMERGEPVRDQRHETLVRRWKRKLKSQENTDYQAGNVDGLVSLMARFGWTEQQCLYENSPDVLAELSAHCEALNQIQEEAMKRANRRSSGRPSSFPT